MFIEFFPTCFHFSWLIFKLFLVCLYWKWCWYRTLMARVHPFLLELQEWTYWLNRCTCLKFSSCLQCQCSNMFSTQGLSTCSTVFKIWARAVAVAHSENILPYVHRDPKFRTHYHKITYEKPEPSWCIKGYLIAVWLGSVVVCFNFYYWLCVWACCLYVGLYLLRDWILYKWNYTDGCELPCSWWTQTLILCKSNRNSQLLSHVFSPLFVFIRQPMTDLNSLQYILCTYMAYNDISLWPPDGCDYSHTPTISTLHGDGD